MKILEIGTLDVKKGGPPFSLSRQMLGLKENNVECCCLMAPCQDEDIIDKRLEYAFFRKPLFNVLGFEYIPHISDSVDKMGKIDLIHSQGIWTYECNAVMKYAIKKGIPYVISPRGALYKKSLQLKTAKKKVAWYAYQKRNLFKAACIQATCIAEMDEVRSLGCKVPVAVIPNPYDGIKIDSCKKLESDIFRIGYMGRLHPRKRVERLIYALDYLIKQGIDAELYIIGADVKSYENFLREESVRLGIEERVVFTGFLKDKAKDNAIKQCHIFAFPSDFENWGNVVPDVLVRGVPAITTKGMPWEIIQKANAGWWINNDQDSFNNTLINAYSLGGDRLYEMGAAGRQIVLDNFSVKRIGAMLKELYAWLLIGGQKPDFVYM